MALYCYVKAPPLISPRPHYRVISGFLTSIGIFILAIVFGTMAIYQWRSRENFQRKTLLFSPIPRSSVLGESEQNLNPVDYAKPKSWFLTVPSFPPRNSKITHYNLSIPALGINQAVVEIGGEDLMKSMVHYSGTALPGQKGNAVIYCHSVLPQFFNPKNYKTICSTLPTIKKGSEIILYFDGIEYHYQIYEMFEVQPNDISVLEQDISGEYLSLITCVPPGTFLRRLVVKARLI